MTLPPLLLRDYVQPGADFAAALTRIEGGPGDGFTLHCHTFWESFLILEGDGVHGLGNQALPLEAGQLWLIRPPDAHSLRPGASGRLRLINVAFSSELWLAFLEVLGCTEQGANWQAAALPPMVRLSGRELDEAQALYHAAIRNALHHPTRVFLGRFWLALLGWLTPLPGQPPGRAAGEQPAWLQGMLQALATPQGLRQGLAAQVAQTGLSAAHVSRSFRALVGQTPTEYLNACRLDRAAALLSGSDTEILEIAHDCGFENLSYFYRRFGGRFGCTPRHYRLRARRSIGPV